MSIAKLRPCGAGILVVVLLGTWCFEAPAARVRLENICTVYGQKESKLTGIGLVIGLNGTGDGGGNRAAMRALAAVLARMNAPVSIDELRDADNVAMVLVEATVPRTGIRKGQRIDCYVSSFMGAKSLRGGRLLVTPLTTAAVANQHVVGLASGSVYVEDENVRTVGLIQGGVVLEDSFPSLFVDRERGHLVTLLLDESHASFRAASEVSYAINTEFSFDTASQVLAKAAGPGVIEVAIPPQYQDDPVRFLALLMAVGIDNPHTQARVVVNAKTGNIVVTGEVEISPVVIASKNLTVRIGDAPLPDGEQASGRFVTLADPQDTYAPQQLQHLLDSLNELRVPTSDIIDIIRELHRSGKLHAAYDEH